jgi:hypothetical protein
VDDDQAEQHQEDAADDEHGDDGEADSTRRDIVDDAELRPSFARCRRSSRLRGRH